MLVMLVMLVMLGCVFPAGSSTGLEFSWRFAEQVSSHARARTCEGALVTHVELRVTDREDAARSETRRYACTSGYAGPGEQSPPLSDAFFDVRPGTYDVELRALHQPDEEDEAVPVAESQTEIVLDHGVVLTPQELPVKPETILLHILDAQDCQEARVRLRYDDPGRDLDGAADEPLYYGDDLEGHHGLSFDGEPVPCWALAGNIFDIDRGRYVLEISRDGGEPCSVPLVVDGSESTLFARLDACGA